jgi:hypothetical protein
VLTVRAIELVSAMHRETITFEVGKTVYTTEANIPRVTIHPYYHDVISQVAMQFAAG